jgi:hypothetical protein
MDAAAAALRQWTERAPDPASPDVRALSALATTDWQALRDLGSAAVRPLCAFLCGTCFAEGGVREGDMMHERWTRAASALRHLFREGGLSDADKGTILQALPRMVGKVQVLAHHTDRYSDDYSGRWGDMQYHTDQSSWATQDLRVELE